jgi:hypothetical protein
VRDLPIRKRGNSMKKGYVPRLKEYEGPFEIDAKRISASLKKHGRGSKLPTSVALEIDTIRDLKKLAANKGVPYQVLMRMFIIEGLHKTKKG